MKERNDFFLKEKKIRAIQRYKAERAIRILIEEIASIRYVKEWAIKANVSKKWLNKEIKKAYGKSPKIILREVRYESIKFLIIQNGVDVTSFTVAIESGVGETSDALYKFLCRHYDTTFTQLKEDILTGKLEINFTWLMNGEERFYYPEYLNWRQKYRNRR